MSSRPGSKISNDSSPPTTGSSRRGQEVFQNLLEPSSATLSRRSDHSAEPFSLAKIHWILTEDQSREQMPAAGLGATGHQENLRS